VSDAQLTIILGAIATLGGSLVAALRWAVQRVTKSNDDGTFALVENTKSNATLITKLDGLSRAIERLDDFVKEEISGIHDGPPKPRARTAPQGVRMPRPGTYHDEDR
jgi:hypothetical protein